MSPPKYQDYKPIDAADLSETEEKNQSEIQVIEPLKNLLQCPVCYELPTSGPIFDCNNGRV